jgi:hypothetical protein
MSYAKYCFGQTGENVLWTVYCLIVQILLTFSLFCSPARNDESKICCKFVACQSSQLYHNAMLMPCIFRSAPASGVPRGASDSVEGL